MKLVCRAISKKYDGRDVLCSISLCLRQGEILSVIGPSGSGKTTLIRVLSTLEKPDGGELELFGNEIKWGGEVIEVRRMIGYVQQKPVLLAGTVYDNIAIPLMIRGFEREDIERRIVKIAEMLGIREILRKNVRKISGGEAQRVAFGRAIAGEPEILFLDEFTANLDYRNAGILERCVLEFCKTGGSVLIVSHNLFQVRRMASKVAILIDGRIVEQGETEDLLVRPKTKLARQFVSGEIPW